MCVIHNQVGFGSSLTGSILDAEGNWHAEEGRYKKTELCREHDLDACSSHLNKAALIFELP